MNSNAQKMNDALTTYRKAKEYAAARVEEYTQKYGPGVGAEEKEYQAGKTQAARAEAEKQIRDAAKAGREAAEYWGKLYGGQLTDDVELLKNDLIDPAEFENLKTRYQDNATMLLALRKYGERKNQEEAEELRKTGGVPTREGYRVKDIITAQDKLENWNKVEAQALDLLDAVDGTGNYGGDNASMGRIWSEEAIGKIGEGVAL